MTTALKSSYRIDCIVSEAFELNAAEQKYLDDEIGPHPWTYRAEADVSEIGRLWPLSAEDLVAIGVERKEARRWLTKKSYFVDRRTELICHILECSPTSLECQVGDIATLLKDTANNVISEAVGVALGRWDDKSLGRSQSRGFASDPFIELSQIPPAAGVHAGGNSETIAVSDPGHPCDIVALVRSALFSVWQQGGEKSFEQVETALAVTRNGIRGWLSTHYFEEHIKRYSRSRRKAPIYWQLATPSASYSIWLYYHHLTKDTCYKVLTDYVTPKLQHEERKLTGFMQSAGESPTSSQRKEIAEQEAFVEELRAFQEEIARIAPLWNPNFNDGVIINFAPLWRLVPQHRAWQKECKSCWDKLVAGDYDWAHLAMHLWPERVVPKCAKDRSLAIAHGIEDVFWIEGADSKRQPRNVNQDTIDNLVKERTSATVKDALQNLLEAPAPATSRGGGSRTTARRASNSRLRRPRADTGLRSEVNTASRATAADADLLQKVKDAIATNGDGASKADVIAATGVTDSQWNAAIKALLAAGAVTQSGERRGARYHLAETGGTF